MSFYERIQIVDPEGREGFSRPGKHYWCVAYRGGPQENWGMRWYGIEDALLPHAKPNEPVYGEWLPNFEPELPDWLKPNGTCLVTGTIHLGYSLAEEFKVKDHLVRILEIDFPGRMALIRFKKSDVWAPFSHLEKRKSF